MKKVLYIFSGIWRIYAMLILSVSLILLYPLYALLLRKESSYKYAYKLLQGHTLFVLTMVGVFVVTQNKQYLKNIGACIITPNHSSYIDILVLYRVVPDYFIFMGKHTLLTIPIFNIFFKKMNIAVNRKSIVSGKNAMTLCAKELDKGHGVLLFPEGTIPDDAPNLMRFKAGAFKLAIDKQAPIVPVTFLSNYKRLRLGGIFSSQAGPGIARVIVNKPIATKGMTTEDLLPLQNKVFNLIKEQLTGNGHR